MARPMLLMQKSMLKKLWDKQQLGVPVSTMIQQEKLEVTPPTLTKLLSYYTVLQQEDTQENTDVLNMMMASLFPSWLEADKRPDIVKQPSEWVYDGTFPLGRWVLRVSK